ncbi:hypothetical protein MNEG_7053 [Monoraphidium neglectum]|uniref:Uncharacterized protein n=1 Tax=Monoraphidium neglectum TaxID=145388 RepID=A0A0D2JP36_9CHLO|nr:hypothetical protein MNEG_7053 [Monoraphidium neglectum]KIZ00908.1 hypothetical protein MNEG_7053 [Monoraphidium neglectum]|eukprot:XP_013899927.1 hypothetical protein MNEG_7053 [Monoraphidium neglectum]
MASAVEDVEDQSLGLAIFFGRANSAVRVTRRASNTHGEGPSSGRGRRPRRKAPSQGAIAAASAWLKEEVFGGDRARMEKAVMRRPSLLRHTLDAFHASLAALVQLFGSADAALTAVRRYSDLLIGDASILPHNARALAQLLDLADDSQLARRLLRHPRLLHMSPESLRAKLERLAAGLGMGLEDARLMCRTQPSLLGLRTEGVVAKANLIKSYPVIGASLSPAYLARLLVLGRARLARLEYLATEWAAANPGARLLTAGTVLGMPPDKFEERWRGFRPWLEANAAYP